MNNLIIFPFTAGLVYLCIVLLFRIIMWVAGLSKMDKLRLFQMLRSQRVWQSVRESFMEGLLHRKIIKKNGVLGYMHMSLAFGWFLLIVVGHIEAMVASKTIVVPHYMPVFFRFFHHSHFPLATLFSFTMDLLLLVVLSGLALALFKRMRSSLFGIRQATRLKSGDRIALTSLWLIFPLRLLAEGAAAAQYGNGSFLTQATGTLLSNFFNPAVVNYPLWVAYSLSLGFFFVALPNSRYMHIPGEILFIFLRQAGIRLKKRDNTYTRVQVFSCSRCGLCLDNCQMSTAGINDTQSVYILKRIRNHNLTDEHLFNCLLCGKCQVDCPVGIDTIDLRITQRIESTLQYNSSYGYLNHTMPEKADAVYFAGCMTHLTPGIIGAMQSLFRQAGLKVWFMDEEKSPCCGRPLMLAGQYEAASKLIAHNSRQIALSGAKRLIVSCPICYRVFREDYELQGVEVIFHVRFIEEQIANGNIRLLPSAKKLIYHDPCELGRGMGMFDAPRRILKQTGDLLITDNEREMAYCCGGSLGNLKISQAERNILRHQAMSEYRAYNPDLLVTACPLCKKTFSRDKNLPVLDIAEVVVKHQYTAADELLLAKRVEMI